MYALLYVLLLALYSLISARFIPERLYSLSNLLAAILAVNYGLWQGLNWQDLGLGVGSLWKGAAAGIVMGVFAVILISSLFFHKRLREVFMHKPSRYESSKETVLELGFRIPFGTALAEEILFRGVLLGLLLPRGTVFALIISSFLFGLWHIIPTLDGMLKNDAITTFAERKKGGKGLSVMGTIASTTFAGLAFGWLRIISESLVAPWLMHAAINLTAVAGGFIAVKRTKK